jgi:aspartate/methionine/tyrosine aminotransferase
LVDLAHERSVTIISDESYQRFIHDDGKQTSLASFGVDDPLLVTATSLSKNYAFTQWRVGYVLGPPRLVSAATTVFNWDALYVGHVQQAAALAAITGPQDWVSGALDQYPSKRDRLVDAVNAIDGLAVVRPQAGSWAYIDATALGLADEQLEDRLIRLGVAAASSRFFQGPPGHLRVVYGSSVDVLDRTVAALRQLASGADAPVAE